MSPPEVAILKTLSYADVFDYPLTQSEIYSRLISSTPVPKKDLSLAISHLLKSNQVIHNRAGESEKLFALSGRSQLFSLRSSRSVASQKKQNKTRKWVGEWGRVFPFIDAIYLTGSVASGNANPDDDIDLMIVTRPKLMWTARLILTLTLDLLRLRRKPEMPIRGRGVTNKFCTNLFLDSHHLKLAPNRRNLYTAYEIHQAQLLWQRQSNLDAHFRHQNRWVLNFLPHSPLPPTLSYPFNPLNPFFQVFTPLEFLAYKFQQIYMNKHRTQEETTTYSAFFHPRQTAPLIMSHYHQRLHSLGLTSTTG